MSQSHTTRDVSIGPMALPGTLALPSDCNGLVVFAHGSGSSRLSPRNTHVARQLNSHGFATLLFDLLRDQEAEDRRNVFDISLLGSRVHEALRWVSRQDDLATLQIGIFGASTGAAAALVAAAKAPCARPGRGLSRRPPGLGRRGFEGCGSSHPAGRRREGL